MHGNTQTWARLARSPTPPPPHPNRLSPHFYSSLLSSRAGLAPPSASSPSIIEETAASAPITSAPPPPHTPLLSAAPRPPLGAGERWGGLPRSLGEGSYWLVSCPRLGRAPGTGILGVPGQSALCISRWRGCLCLRRRPGCLADAIRIISEPRDPEPPKAAEGGQKPPRLSSRCWAPAALLDAPSTPSICRGMELMR